MRSAPVLALDAQGCLSPSGEVLPEAQRLAPLASDGRFLVIDETLSAIRVEDVQELHRAEVPLVRTATVQVDTTRYQLGEDGCPVEVEPLAEHSAVQALARAHDANYRGLVVIDDTLSLAPVRAVQAEGWRDPWHASVQLVKEVPEGFLIGGGIMVSPQAILTAAHLGVDSSFCYSRAPNAGVAWSEERFICDNIASVQPHPAGVDVAIIHLAQPELPPFAAVRRTPLAEGEAFYAANLSSLHTHVFSDSTVLEVGDRNAWCDDWPSGASFLAVDLIVGGGDSGGPAFVGDEVVGLVHGEVCRLPIQQNRHAFVHLPGVLDFLAPVLP